MRICDIQSVLCEVHTTFEERASFKLSRLNVIIGSSMLFVTLIGLLWMLITLTSLKYYIPGYADTTIKKEAKNIYLKTRALETQMQEREQYLQSVLVAMKGGQKANLTDKENTELKPKEDNSNISNIEPMDSALRATMESKNMDIKLGFTNEKDIMSRTKFFKPINGSVIDGFSVNNQHYGVDVSSKINEPVRAVLDGTVILSTYSIQDGYEIVVQHRNNIISFYKHNSKVFKKVGNFVKSGEAIAIVGNTGENSTGPHLHFELWFNGVALDPVNFISF